MNKDAIYEELRLSERHRISLSKVARVMQSVQLKQARAEANVFRSIAE